MSWPETTTRGERGEIELGGVSTVALAREFGTPLYVFDELTVRHRARMLIETFTSAYPRTRVLYAGKAYLSLALTRILAEEGLGLDVVSGGEIHAGLRAGVDPRHMVFHGNNKSRAELEEAVAAGVRYIAVDNELEIDLLSDMALIADRELEVLLRVNPGIDPHTHHKMRTGATDSKFGFPIWDGQAERAAARIAGEGRLSLVGYHAHVGSQIFDADLVEQTLEEIFALAANVAAQTGATPRVISPGGGFGVADNASGDDVSLARWAAAVARTVGRARERYGFDDPWIFIEPGRALIGPAGVALYTVGARKSIPGVREYISVDGGMADNIRPALYGARYSAALANRSEAGLPRETVTIAGKYCESGDILIEAIDLPRLQSGDLLAIPMAGAYCLAMASNYNLSPRPAAVLVGDGRARLIRRRETYEDLLQCEIIDDEVEPVAVGPRLSLAEGSL